MNKKKLSAIFIKGLRGTDPIMYDGKSQIVFIGRSNVGKSSVINSLVGKPLARSSTAPGKTINLDFFLIDNAYYFVDLPGYGFAQASKDTQEHFRKMIAWYLFSSGINHKLIVLIVDTIVGLTMFDRESIDLFIQYDIPFIIVANKIDKLKESQRHKQLLKIQHDSNCDVVIPYSTKTLTGRTELIQQMIAAVV